MNVNTIEEIKEIFELYLNKKSTPEQETALFAYVREHPDTEYLFQEIIEATWTEDMTWQEQPAGSTSKQKLIWLKYAAAILLIGSVALSWFLVQQNSKTNQLQITQIIKTTKRGEKLKIQLPDSSIVYLNAMSKLSFPARFIPGKNREINLEGEAFFEVKHDTSRPFIVRSRNLQTRVLGTSFNIASYPESKTLSISVRTGKVGVSELVQGSQKHLSLLTPGKRLVYNLAKHQYVIDEQKAANFNSWTENRFIFKNETLGTIISTLEKAYNIDFKLANTKILACHFNATFSNKSIKEIADQLKAMSSGKIQYKFNTERTIITLWGEACQ